MGPRGMILMNCTALWDEHHKKKFLMLPSQNRANSSYHAVYVNVMGFLKNEDKTIRVHLKGQQKEKKKSV